jgi:hypothetical protein
MSKYEPRANQLKATAVLRGWKLAWTFRRGRFLYLTITKIGMGNGDDWDRSSIHNRISSWSYPTLLDEMSAWVHTFYPRVKHLTSFGGNKGTWLLLDTWEELSK